MERLVEATGAEEMVKMKNGKAWLLLWIASGTMGAVAVAGGIVVSVLEEAPEERNGKEESK